VSRGRLLLVDDDDDIRAIARMSLTRVGGWEVVPGRVGGRGRGRRARSAPPDVVLLDVMMPDVDGPATLERLRPLIGDAPVIFLTAKTQAATSSGSSASAPGRDRQAVRPDGAARRGRRARR
jgi:DNA-binding response OmpR family regulator